MRRGTTLRTTRRATDLTSPAADVWEVVASGRTGPQWYVDAAPFVFRGAVDRLLGGAGRRGPPPGTPLLAPGDTAGFWRVTEASAGPDRRRLVLEAEVRAPGRVLLTSTVRTRPHGTSRLEQEVAFEPAGIVGRAYLVADLAAREAVLELTHRRLCADIARRPGDGRG
jgi:hypothetical protein